MAIWISGGKENEEKRDELIFDLMKRRYDGEIDIANKLDGKAGNMVGFASIVLALTLGRTVFSGGGAKSFFLLLNSNAGILNFLGMTVLLVSIGCALVALRIKSYSLTPAVNILKDFLKNSETKYLTVLHGITNAMAESISVSERINNRKAMFIEGSWYSLLVGLILIFASYVILALGAGLP